MSEPVSLFDQSKLECLLKPAQSGKTKAIQEIIRDDDGLRDHLNIVICSKNRLLASQTAKRMDGARDDMDSRSVDTDDLDADDAVVGDVYCWMSGAKKTNITVHDLFGKVVLGDVSMIVCCSHKVRFRYIHDLLDLLERFPAFNKPVNVWLDEADAYVNLWASESFDFTRRRSVRKVIPVSATFGNVLKRLGRITVMGLPVTHPICYRGLRDCEIAEEECGKLNSVAYLATMLDKYDAVKQPGTRLFAPCETAVKSHDDAAKELLSRGWAVLVLNGQRKGFLLPDGSFHPIKLSVDGDELAGILATKYAELGLADLPFAVTGRLCLDRGITFQSPDFLFDVGIVPDIDDHASAYQCVARMLGNVGAFPTHQPPLIIMSPKMKEVTMKQERIATNLPKLVHVHEWADIGKEEYERAAYDTEEEYNSAKTASRDKYGDEYYVSWSVEHLSYESLRGSSSDWQGHLKKRPDGEFYSNGDGDGKPMSVEEIEKKKNEAKKDRTGSRHPLKPGKKTSRTYAYYTDVSDPTTVRFIVRTLYRAPFPPGIGPAVDPGAVGPAAAGGLPA
jgi:hypothetical protein